jgi:hypothetical protein
MSSEPISAWQCIGCGRIEAPQTCIGVCQDRRVEFVYAAEHAETEAELEATKRERDGLLALVRRLALSRPRDGEWQRSYRALQDQARGVIGRLNTATPGARGRHTSEVDAAS